MGFCPFMSFRVIKKLAVGMEIIDQTGTVYGRNASGIFEDGSGNGIGDNAPTALVAVTDEDSFPESGTEIQQLRDTEDTVYNLKPDGSYLDEDGNSVVDNEMELAAADTESLSYGFFTCPADESCKLWDPENERCGVMDSGSSTTKKSTVPKASLLVNEYMGGEDLDGNGLVYGKDFFVRESDRPPMLATMPETGTEMTWQQYLNTL